MLFRSQKDNLTPTKATYEVRFQNTKDAVKGDGATTGSDNLRAAHLARVKLKSTFDDNIVKDGGDASEKVFRLQNVYVPAYLVRDGGNNANQYTDHAHCADHRNGTCIEYQYTPYVKVGDKTYEPYTGARKLNGTKQVTDDGTNRQIYLSIIGEQYTTDDYATGRAFSEAEACGGESNQDCACVVCDGGWFNATDFTFTYIDALGDRKSVV